MRVTITKRRVDALAANGKAGDLIADDQVRGFGARLLPSGAVAYVFRYREKAGGKRRWLTLGQHGAITPDQARQLAQGAAGEVAGQGDPLAEREASRQAVRAAEEAARTAPLVTVRAVLEQFMARYVRPGKLRSADEIERTFRVYVYARIGDVSVYALRRSRVAQMLDEIEDQHGPVMADRTLAHVRKAFSWYAARDDEFRSPIVRGMARTKPRERARDRVLSDDEIRDVWRGLNSNKVTGAYPDFVRSVLLSAQRPGEVANMRRREVNGDWAIPPEKYKGKLAHVVPLTEAAAEIIAARAAQLDPKARDADFIFGRDGRTAFSGFSRSKSALDLAIAELREKEGRDPMPPWVIHDLRRTARSLMSRAGVETDVAERVLGHVIPGVRGVYDRYVYRDEKRDALKRLGALVAEILEPAPAGKVVKLRA